MAERTYLDFAEDDKLVFDQMMKDGLCVSTMAAIAQNSCEKYLKHVISVYSNINNLPETKESLFVMKTHSLENLINYLEKIGVELDSNVSDNILKADGYYFSARYPGNDSIDVTPRIMERCHDALEACQGFVLSIIDELSKESEQMKEDENSFSASLMEQLKQAVDMVDNNKADRIENHIQNGYER